MNLALSIARRYLFGVKKTNTINIITGIAAVGISIGAAALLLVLCVFNGFEMLVIGLMGTFNPDVKILPATGKTFTIDSVQIAQLKKTQGVDNLTITLEEIAFFNYAGNQDFATIKGVDADYKKVTALPSAIKEGKYLLETDNRYFAVVGAGIRNKLGINVDNPLEPLTVYMAKREEVGPLEQQFRTNQMLPIGTFSIQQDFDNQYVIASLAMVQGLLNQPNQASSIEVKLHRPTDKKAIDELRKILGEKFIVKDKFQQNEAFLKIMNIEKWMSFVILTLTLILVAFNLIGALWMIVLDKKTDISILKSFGMSNLQVRNIFLGVGIWLVGMGLLVGLILGISLYLLHKKIGIIPVPEGFLIDSYPAELRFSDIMIVSVTVFLIGILAAVPAALKAKNMPSTLSA
jgi:lipoprotein-releasing system permease protein